MKYVSSGWPAEIKKLQGAEQIRAMREYCLVAKEKYGIEFRPCDVKENPGFKFLAKLMLNCKIFLKLNFHNLGLWGRFALRMFPMANFM